MKSEAQHAAEQELATAAAIADVCHPDRIPNDVLMAQARALVGIGQGLLVLCEEIRESRLVETTSALPGPVVVRCECASGVSNLIRPDRVSESAQARGHLALALLVMAGTNVLLLVLCVVLALS